MRVMAPRMARVALTRARSVADAAVRSRPPRPISRLDDYGLRHPNPFGATTTDSRLDDYGLRHPNP